MKYPRAFALTAALLGATALTPGRSPAQAEARTAVLYRESYALEAKQDYTGALARMREISREAGTSYFATIRMAWLSYLVGDYAGSVASYTNAVATEPKAIEPRLGLTLTLLAARNWRELERASRDVLVMDARNATALARLAAAQYWGGNYAAAEATYRQLTADYPSDLDYKTGLGWTLLKLGRTAEARQFFTSVLAVSPDNSSAKQGLAVK